MQNTVKDTTKYQHVDMPETKLNSEKNSPDKKREPRHYIPNATASTQPSKEREKTPNRPKKQSENHRKQQQSNNMKLATKQSKNETKNKAEQQKAN